MADGVHVAGLAGHQIAGALAVVEGKILLQQPAVNRVTQGVECAL